MQATLILTARDCFRPPAVMEHARTRLASGGSVAMATRDHPDTLPDFPEFAAVGADDWEAVLQHPPSLAVLDNLRFRDCRGQVFERWSETGWQEVPAATLEKLVRRLRDRAEALILVSGDDSVSGAWRGWLDRHHVGIERHVGHPARRWCIRNPANGMAAHAEAGPAGLPGNTLQMRLDPAAARRLECEVVAPEQEALLSLMAEYTTLRYDYRNPADPRWLNVHDDTVREIIGAYAWQASPNILLEALESLHDVLSEYVDFREFAVDEVARAGPGGGRHE